MATIAPKHIIDKVLDLEFSTLFEDFPQAVYFASVPLDIKNPDLDAYYCEIGIWNETESETEICGINLSRFLKSSNLKKIQNTVKQNIKLENHDRVDNEDINLKVEEVNPFKLQHKITENTIRPLAGGCSIKYENSESTGTLGAIVKLNINNDLCYILSNYHVLSPPKFESEKLIFQPSEKNIYRQKDYSNLIGKLALGKFDEQYDIAFAQIINMPLFKGGVIWNNKQILKPKKIVVGEKVKIYGATSYKSKGRIKSDNAYVKLEDTKGNTRYFHKQILTTNMSRPGDSGSILLNKKNNGIGLLIGGDEKKYSVFNNLNTIFNTEIGLLPEPDRFKIKIEAFIKP